LKILVTGATGFIGQAVISALLANPVHHLYALTRPKSGNLPEAVTRIDIENLDGETDYGKLLDDIDVIIHLAAHVHQPNDTADAQINRYHAVNTEGTLNLASQAAAAGVGRFIYLSTIKVNGEFTRPGHPFTADDQPNPGDHYAVSKSDAERGLRMLTTRTRMSHVIIRPPLVYGPGVKANFLKIINVVSKGIPLPFGAINNRRSLVSLENLTNLICRCIDHPRAANQTFLVSDDRDVSTSELLRMIAHSLGKPCRLFVLPDYLLNLAATLFGKQDIAIRLFGNLQVDVEKTKSLLDWRAVGTLEESINTTVMSYKRQTR
jgi:nucleoside-diphosphate-sugar epimerase